MNYLVKLIFDKPSEDVHYKPSLEDIIKSRNIVIIEQIESNSLFYINKILIEMDLPIIRDINSFREDNNQCIYRFSYKYFVYLLSDNDLNIKQKIRDIKLSKII